MSGVSNYQLKAFVFSSHYQISQLLNNSQAKSILDLGCGEGFIGRILKYKPKKMVGVDKLVFNDLKNYTDFYQKDLDQSSLVFLKNNKYEAIILADFLEHLKYPQQVLKDSLNYLVKNGVVIISVPNTGYWFVRILYFFNIRPKFDRTIFDRTHLHDFNLPKIRELLKKNKLQEIQLQVTPIPLPALSPIFNKNKIGFFLYYFNYFLAQKWPDFFAYQLILIAKSR